MKTLSIIMATGLALSLGACKGAEDTTANNASTSTSGPVAPPAGQQWTDVVSKTEDGGYLMGNPNASVKLIEYGALSCPVCGRFYQESHVELKELVSKGTMSFEFRPFLVHPQDPSAFLVAQCNGPQAFFPLSDQMFIQQESWMAKTANITPQDQESWRGKPQIEVVAAMGKILGVDTLVGQFGVPAQKASACLADSAALDALTKVSEGGVEKFNVTGTPSFIINGKKVEGITWADIKPQLLAAGA